MRIRFFTILLPNVLHLSCLILYVRGRPQHGLLLPELSVSSRYRTITNHIDTTSNEVEAKLKVQSFGCLVSQVRAYVLITVLRSRSIVTLVKPADVRPQRRSAQEAEARPAANGRRVSHRPVTDTPTWPQARSLQAITRRHRREGEVHAHGHRGGRYDAC